MRLNVRNLIGDETVFSTEHQILNIVLIFGFIIASWSTFTNYLLNLDTLLVLTCLIASIFLLGLYYLSRKRNQYRLPVFALIIAAFIITPLVWFCNGGISGSIPFYIILFSLMAAALFSGKTRLLIVGLFIAMVCGLVLGEYRYPFLVIAYSSYAERYVDILIGLVTIVIANVVVFVVILNCYKNEQEQAKKYFAKSEEAQADLLYLSYHDAMTGLYNRTYFEQLVKDLERDAVRDLGIFAIDVDGLKFVNDTFGHEQGDAWLLRAVAVLRAAFRPQDIIIRVGGDEFAVLVLGSTGSEMEVLYSKIRVMIAAENTTNEEWMIPLQLSAGYAYQSGTITSVRNLLEIADRKMYREKLYHQAETKGILLKTVQKMLCELDFGGGLLKDSLQQQAMQLARAAGLPESQLGEFQLLAEFYDVGKIGIPKRVLYKDKALTRTEREQIERHCEIGYRISQYSTELLPIANGILKHHEWWNGAGYPFGLKGEQIPKECRIIAIVDAYAAMTSVRPYRPEFTHEAAIAELLRCSGTQFDPALVNLFVTMQQNLLSSKAI